MKRVVWFVGLMVAVLGVGFAGHSWVSAQNGGSVDKAALERSRKTVKMLDDVYKTAVVLITDKYVKGEKDFPAGRAAVKWFEAISEKGWHHVRIVDASGEPYNPVNVAKDAFEKRGVAAIKGGKTYFDEVEMKDGKAYLRATTFIPVVMEKCVMCHANYKNAKKNEAIGALTYRIAIE